MNIESDCTRSLTLHHCMLSLQSVHSGDSTELVCFASIEYLTQVICTEDTQGRIPGLLGIVNRMLHDIECTASHGQSLFEQFEVHHGRRVITHADTIQQTAPTGIIGLSLIGHQLTQTELSPGFRCMEDVA